MVIAGPFVKFRVSAQSDRKHMSHFRCSHVDCSAIFWFIITHFFPQSGKNASELQAIMRPINHGENRIAKAIKKIAVCTNKQAAGRWYFATVNIFLGGLHRTIIGSSPILW